MKDLSRLSAALMLILGLAACGQDTTTDSPIRQVDQATEEAAGTTSGMAQDAMDAASVDDPEAAAKAKPPPRH
ncbi:MAG: hypothetical protein RIC56_10085 [Pseudomonadales bacterium]